MLGAAPQRCSGCPGHDFTLTVLPVAEQQLALTGPTKTTDDLTLAGLALVAAGTAAIAATRRRRTSTV